MTIVIKVKTIIVTYRSRALGARLSVIIKGLVHFQIKIGNVIQDVYVFLSSVEKKLRFLMKTFQESSSYSAVQWTPNG